MSGYTFDDFLRAATLIARAGMPIEPFLRPQYTEATFEVIDTTYPARDIPSGPQIASCDDGTTTTYEEIDP